MTERPTPRPIRYLGSSVPYSEGVEDELVRVLSAATDTSDGSDELVRSIVDWPTRYHFSTLRTNLLRPLDIRPGMRVLDVGCGSGATTRYLAEQGADVVALEGNALRATATALRCAGLDNVDVLCGPIEHFDEEGFDLVLVVGVLEYSDRLIEHGGHRRFMQHLVGRLAPRGTVALAIENQLGLKYLLGHHEDHLGAAWVGVEGYLRSGGVQTWSRRRLGSLFDDVGLTNQRWLYPFPDYKLPTAVIDAGLYELPSGPRLISQFLRDPVVDHLAPPVVLADARSAHRVLLDAGLGQDVANSFLVVASVDAPQAELPVRDGRAWFFGGQRLRPWRRARVLSGSEGDLQLLAIGAPATVTVDWITMTPHPAEAVIDGEPLDVVLSRSLAAGDLETFAEVVAEWWSYLVSAALPDGAVFEMTNPFMGSGSQIPIDGRYLDANFDNFIRTSGGLVFVDTELRAAPAVHAEMVALRAFRVLAQRACQRGLVLPWDDDSTVDQVTERLWESSALPRIDLVPDDLADAEGVLQHIVTGADAAATAAEWRQLGRKTIGSFGPRTVPVTRLQDAVATIREERDRVLAALAEQSQTLEAVQTELERVERVRRHDSEALIAEAARIDKLRRQDVDELRAALDWLEQARVAETGALRAELSEVGAQRDRLDSELTSSMVRIAELERRFGNRVAHRVHRMIRR